MTDLTAIYDARVADGTLTEDAVQRAALPELQRVLDDLAAPPPKRGLFGRGKVEPVRGLYLWGGVGRGKSMLMDLFHDAAPEPRKRRVHFHAFMQEVQAALHEARQEQAKDPIKIVADDIIKDVRLLSFDEMQITDIADAMIVGRLFEQLFAAGVAVVTTSNRVPQDLYKDGLNRQLFLPFIALLQTQMVVWELASDTDYRQGRLQGQQVYFYPHSPAVQDRLETIFKDLTHGKAAPLDIQIKGRIVRLPAFHNGVAKSGFHALCHQPLGPGDYLEIARLTRVLVLEDIPRLSRRNFNEAKRFVTLVDALYEAKVRLICSAASRPDMLYVEGEGSFEFERTASRLMEMQDADWGRAA